ncbi:hypothetical protein VV01_16395 [Luteipulveratus halotolerans]|uniref:AbiEi antitoxin C-terminal domain-containing protein n=1 Tax=Luteipulveratus halotolerans TaxID=1631356 RepID=A0A0L6CPG7_9MICO|nr:hypothetical protein VV01_16395 [Luteipulveratus halotolerans]
MRKLLVPTRAHQAMNDGAHVRLRRGLYVPRAAFDELTAAERLQLAAYAVDHAAQGAHTFSHHAAAALWDLPIVGTWPTLVERTTSAGSKGRSPGARRRRREAEPAPVEHRGLLVTSPARTVIDLAREARLESALATADHALRLGLCSRSDLRAEVEALAKGARGKRKATLVVHLADPLSESVGESLSRARMFQLNVPRPALQTTFSDEDGLIGRVDFWWEELGLIGEFDGRVKYGVDDDESPTQAGERLWREKRREDRLRGGGRRRVGRWVWADALDLERFRQVLLRLGVRDTGADSWAA